MLLGVFGAWPVNAASPSAVYEWISPTGAACSGGDTSQGTIAQARHALAPAIYPDPTSPDLFFLNHVYPGTRCTSAVAATTLISGGPTTQVTTYKAETSPVYSCPRTPAYARTYNGVSGYGCIGENAQVTVSYTLTNDDYDMRAFLDFNFDGFGYGSWTNRSQNLHDNNGGNWGASTGTYTAYNRDGQGFYSTEQNLQGFGTYQAVQGQDLIPLFGIFTFIFRNANETVHVGIKGTANYPGALSGDYCWFGEFKPETASVTAMGQCGSP